MKKLIAAAVATSVSAVAFADLSITGSLKTNYTHKDYELNTGATAQNDKDSFSTEGDLKILGKSGDSTVVMNFGNIDASSGNGNSPVAEDVYVTTKIGDINVKMGDYDNGNNAYRASTRAQRASLSTSLGGFDIAYTNGNGTANGGDDYQDDEVSVSTTLGGVKAKYTAKDSADAFSVSTTVGGVNVAYTADTPDAANKDRTVVELSTEVQGVGIKLGQVKAETGTTISGDSWMGDYESSGGLEFTPLAGQDVTAVELSTSVAGNTVKFRNINVDGYATAGYDWSMNKVIVTRPLASGATLEVTYKDIQDDATTYTDVEVLDVELAVSF
jgi:hypothetical protein